MDFPTAGDLYDVGRDYVRQKAVKIDPATIDVVGSDVNIFVGSVSEVAFAIVLQLMFAVNRLLLDGAEKEDLDRYALDRYQLPRKGASPSIGTVRVYRTSFAAGGGTIPIGTVLKSLPGIDFVTISEIVFGNVDLSSTGAVRATTAGSNTKVGQNAIRKFEDITLLWDSTLLLNNDVATAGGEDVEDDPTFRARIRSFWNTARRGTLAAIEFGATTVPGVVSAQAIEALNGDANPARVVTLYVSDGSGNSNLAFGQQVANALDEYRAGGIAVIVSTSTPFIISVALMLAFRSAVDTQTLGDSIRGAIVEFINSLPVNGTLYRAQLFSVLQRFAEDGLVLSEDSIVSPIGDVVPDPGRTFRTTPANVTIQ